MLLSFAAKDVVEVFKFSGGGVVAELFVLVLASPELNPDDPFLELLHPGLTIKSAWGQSDLSMLTFQFDGLVDVLDRPPLPLPFPA